MIRRVRIRGYKSLEDVDVELQPLTIVFGPNAAGKSNLFDALALLSRMATRRTIKDAFDDHRGAPLEAFFFGPQGISGLLKKPSAAFSIQVDVYLQDSIIKAVNDRITQMREGLPPPKQRVFERNLRYEVTVEIQTSTGHLRVVDERLQALKKDGTPRRRPAFIELAEDGRLHLRIEGQAHPTYHEIGLDYTLVSLPLYPPHYPHITAFREELSRWRFYYLEPDAMRADTPLKEATSMGHDGADIAAFLNYLKTEQPNQFQTLNKAVASLLPTIGGLEVLVTPKGYVDLSVLEGGVQFSSRVISEGTLRVLGLLAIASPLSQTAVIGYEEPENGVHPRRLQLIAKLLTNAVERGSTQILINTHSPRLPTYFKTSQLVVCRKEGLATRFDPFSSLGPMFVQKEIEEALEERIVRGDFGG